TNRTQTNSNDRITLRKSVSNGLILDETSQAGQSQVKLMPILESGENEDKLNEQQPTRINQKISFKTTTLDWTPNEYVSSRISPLLDFLINDVVVVVVV
ncbi:unnamed protein product, partial [Rotaria socialis]